MYKIIPTDRKEVVRRLEELSSEKSRYTGVPRCAYVLRGIVIERNGMINTEADADMDLLRMLITEGLVELQENEEEIVSEEIAPDEDDVNMTTEVRENDAIETSSYDEVTEAESEEATSSEETDGSIEASEDETAEAENEEATSSEENAENAINAEIQEAQEAAQEAVQETQEVETNVAESVAEDIRGEPEETCDNIDAPESTDEGNPTKPIISFPLSDHNVESIRNLVFTIYSRGKLLSKATGGDFFASEALVEDLQRGVGFNSIEKVLAFIERVKTEEFRGISFEHEEKGEGKVKFDGFPETSDTKVVQAWTVLADAINKNTIKQHHVRAKKVDDTNEKFSFRTWLTRLGLNGSDLKIERNILYRNLSGHTAFRNEEAQRRWTERQKAKQEALREQKAMAAMATMTTTATMAANVENVED